jgi:squalene synthase HpnC
MSPLPPNFEIAKELPHAGCSVKQAEYYTRWLATHHYENFIVASVFLPRHLRQHFYNVYAYCRWADDLADEIPEAEKALELLNWWGTELHDCYAGAPSHPVFIALKGTIEKFNMPIQPFSDLLAAFRQDQTVRRYTTWSDVLDYCRYSANPVGRLVLYLCGYTDSERWCLSDYTCTALQLANFWQDVSRDLDKDRIYIPTELLAEHGIEETDLFEHRFDNRYAGLMRVLVQRTRELFRKGLPLAGLVAANIRVDIELFSRGGLAVLDAIESIGYNTLEKRPSLRGSTKLKLIGRALGEHALSYATR